MLFYIAFFKVRKRIKNFLWFIMGFMFSCNVLPEKAWKLTKYVLPRVKKLEKSTFNDDLVVISKEFKRLYINVNPSKWKSFNYRNIYSWRYSIIGKHSPVHTSIAAFEYSIRNCHSLSDYIIITKPIHATRPFIRIEILIFQGQERQVFSSNLTNSNYNFEFVPRPLFFAGAVKYEDACRHIGKKWLLKMPKVCSFNSRWWTRRTGINCFFPVFSSFYVFLKRFTLITSHLQWVDFMM